MLVANTHLHWNPKFDYVKFGQSFWLLKCVATFIKENNLNVDSTPIIICGDFNSKPSSSVFHCMNGRKYDATIDGRNNDKTGIKAYRKKEGVSILKVV